MRSGAQTTQPYSVRSIKRIRIVGEGGGDWRVRGLLVRELATLPAEGVGGVDCLPEGKR